MGVKDVAEMSVVDRERVDGLIESLVRSSVLFRCAPCNVLFPEYSVYLLHVGMHGSAAEFQCHYCRESFAEKFSFLSHFVRCPHDAVRPCGAATDK